MDIADVAWRIFSLARPEMPAGAVDSISGMIDAGEPFEALWILADVALDRQIALPADDIDEAIRVTMLEPEASARGAKPAVIATLRRIPVASTA